ncbi:PaaI family thioesterase [Celeribacter sp.]|uniref:PaaI family thioesterase n=1 Tax=Celeribacter sp. TaxID=1890673 RepID=UPI003A9093D4
MSQQAPQSQVEETPEVAARRDHALAIMTHKVPYLSRMGFVFAREGSELSARMPYHADLIGNPMLPALHGGAIAAFLEMTALMHLSWERIWPDETAPLSPHGCPVAPKIIDLTVDYMRSGRPEDVFGAGRVSRAGRRFATVHSEVWQDDPARPIAQAVCHFLMPRRDG